MYINAATDKVTISSMTETVLLTHPFRKTAAFYGAEKSDQHDNQIRSRRTAMAIHVLSENPRLSITDGALDYIRSFKSNVEREHGEVRIVLYVDSEIFICNERAPASVAASEDTLREWLANNASVRRDVPMVGANPPDRFPWLNKVEVGDIEFDLHLETFPANISAVEVDESNKLILV